MKKGIALAIFYLAFCGTAFAGVVYEQPYIGQSFKIMSGGDYHRSFYQYYVGGATLANPPVTDGFVVPSTYNKIRIKKMLGTPCSYISGGTNLDSFVYGREAGDDYCEFYIYDNVGNAGKTDYLYFFGNGQDLVFDGNSANAGLSIDGYNDHSIPGGFAFQLCQDVCDRDFVLGPAPNSDYPTRIFSFSISTSTKNVSVYDYINPNDIGAKINLTITSPRGQFFSAGVLATTTGIFYYTWNYPEFPENKTGFDDYTFYTDIATSTVIKSKSVTINNLEVPIIGRPGYGNSVSDSSVTIPSSYDYLVQTLGAGLSGTLNRIDIQTSNQGAIYYGSQAMIALRECDSYTYENEYLDTSKCKVIYQGLSDKMNRPEKTTQSYYFDQASPIVFDPTKYYLFTTSGTYQFDSLSTYYGSVDDMVNGACYQTRQSQGKFLPCPNIADLYFTLYGVTKAPPGPPPCAVDCFSNVLFLPGLEASRLYMPTPEKCPLNCEDQLWEPNLPSDTNDLYLDSNGNSINSSIYTKDIIDSTNVTPKIIYTKDIYRSLIVKLDDMVSSWKISQWKSYAYDWRQGINDIVQNGTKYNNDQIFSLLGMLQSLANTSKTGKVTIIAHSNGGLLAKALIKKLEDDKTAGKNDLIDKIDKLILVASPQLGTPDALIGLLHGYGQALPYNLMSEQQARTLGQNMPSAYGLLPSEKYFEQPGTWPVSFFASTSAQKYQTNYGSDIDNYQEEHNFVLGQEGRTQPVESDLISPIKGNSGLLSQAESLHNSIDNMVIPPSIKVIQIAGWGKATITGINYTDSGFQPIRSIRGDHTVFMPSALYGVGTKYWLDLSDSVLEHKNILEDPQLLDFIASVIKQEPLSFPKITYSEPLQIGNRLHLSAHSPVTLGATDTLGNFTGKVCDENNNCYIQENIPGSTYDEFGEGKYVTLSEDRLQKVVMQGMDTGTFTFNFEKVAPDQTSQIQSFIDIPVTTQTQAEITVNSAGMPQLALDVTGDGKTDVIVTPSDIFDPISYLQIMKITIDSLDITQAKKNTFDKRVDNIIKSIQKGKVNKATLKADKFKTVLENKLEKPDPKKPKPKRLSKTDAQLLLDILNKLLDNLS